MMVKFKVVVPDSGRPEEHPQTPVKTPVETPLKGQAGDEGSTTQETTQEKVLAILRKQSGATRNELADRIGITPDGIKYHLTKLRASGVIRHIDPTKSGHWEFLEDQP